MTPVKQDIAPVTAVLVCTGVILSLVLSVWCGIVFGAWRQTNACLRETPDCQADVDSWLGSERLCAEINEFSTTEWCCLVHF